MIVTRGVMLSVLMAVYKNDNVGYLKESIDSILNQTRKADEVLIVKDGPLTDEIENLLSSYLDPSLRYLALPINRGLALALREGVAACRGEFIARMDSDDICHPDRFRQQLEAFEKDPSVDVVGTSILEFENSPSDGEHIRELPSGGEELLKYAKRRSPVNHASVMYKRKAVLEAGNYQDFLWNEDYHLWSRMIRKGFKFKNVKPALLFVRGGQAMYKRRGGLKYAVQDVKLQWFFYQTGFLNLMNIIINIGIRVPVRLVPNQLRKMIYESFLRKT